MARGWVLQDCVLDPLELSDDVKTSALAMASEKALDVTADRERILVAAAHAVELYCGQAFFQGLAGSARVATSVLDVDGPGDVPVIALLPSTTAPISVTSVSRWDDAAEVFQSVSYKARPVGRIRVDTGGVYQVVAAVTPSLTYPVVVVEAVARVFAYQEHYKPRLDTSDFSGGAPPSITGAVQRSGAGELLRFSRAPGV